VLAEFCAADLTVLLGTPDHFSVHTLGELLPFSFTKDEL
jgi:cytidine deaminase